MATLLEVVNRVLEMESHREAEDAVLQAAVRSAINEGLDVLYEDRPWWWTEQIATVTADGDGNLVLPYEATQILAVYDSADSPLHPRARAQQLDHRSNLTSKGIKTYALGGYDSGTVHPVLALWPAGDGDYTVRYQPYPEALEADADVIPGPRAVAHYLTYYARWVRLHGDEERQNQWQQAWQMVESHKRRLAMQNGRYLDSLTHWIGVPRG